ncbi:MAG: hypothetical protein AABY22_11240 [Nanoarchaeota archaeon]
MYYSSKNCKIIINGSEIAVNQLDLLALSDLSAHYAISNKMVERYGGNILKNIVNLNYYITGLDTLKLYLGNRTEFISGNFGGISMKNGAISSYSINGRANEPLIANVKIDFFEEFEGIFSPTILGKLDFVPLNFYNILISGDATGIMLEPVSLNYNANINVIPQFNMDQNTSGYNKPVRIHIDKGESNLSFETSNLNMVLPFTGIKALATVQLKNDQATTFDSFSVSGVINSKRINFGVGGIILNNINIKEDTLILTPNVTGIFLAADPFVSSTSFNPGDFVLLWGENLSTIDIVRVGSQDVFFGNLPAFFFGNSIDKPYTVFKMPNLGGDLIVISEGGSDKFATPLTIIDSGIPEF